MRQVTGSNHSATEKKVSIQLRLGGHSFSCNELPAQLADDTFVEVEVLTSKSVVVPTECFEPALAGKYLEMSGVNSDDDEVPVWSADVGGVTAIVAMAQSAVEALNDRFGDRVVFSSPLLRECGSSGAYLYIYTADKVAYLKLHDGANLLLCEALDYASGADVLYFVERIVSEFGAEKFDVLLAGDDYDTLSRLLKHYYRVRKCE